LNLNVPGPHEVRQEQADLGRLRVLLPDVRGQRGGGPDRLGEGDGEDHAVVSVPGESNSKWGVIHKMGVLYVLIYCSLQEEALVYKYSTILN